MKYKNIFEPQYVFRINGFHFPMLPTGGAVQNGIRIWILHLIFWIRSNSPMYSTWSDEHLSGILMLRQLFHFFSQSFERGTHLSKKRYLNNFFSVRILHISWDIPIFLSTILLTGIRRIAHTTPQKDATPTCVYSKCNVITSCNNIRAWTIRILNHDNLCRSSSILTYLKGCTP